MLSLGRLIKEFDTEIKELKFRNDADTNKMLNEKKQSMVKELNSYVAMKKQYATNLENKRVDLFEDPSETSAEDNVLLASNMTNQQLIDHGNRMMDDTDQAIDRAKKVVQETIDVGTETSAALKEQIASDNCFKTMLFIIVIGIITIIIVKIAKPHNKEISDIPGLAPPVPNRRLLWTRN
nr:novel plant SNARE 11-like [Ipomoea batatas]